LPAVTGQEHLLIFLFFNSASFLFNESLIIVVVPESGATRALLEVVGHFAVSSDYLRTFVMLS
jgi:hypothetical protein